MYSVIHIYADHEDLRKPKPGDLYEGLQPVPILNLDLVQRKQMEQWKICVVDGRQQILVGPEYGVFADYGDFANWAEFVITHIVTPELERRKKKTPKGQKDEHVPFQPSPLSLEFGISLLWPSQSFASLVLFRGLPQWRHGEFHLHRIHLLAGLYMS